MKAITINVSEPTYESFQQYAKKVDRKAAELIREAMELYQRQHIQRQTNLRERRPPVGVGGAIRPLSREDDLLGEMLDDTRD